MKNATRALLTVAVVAVLTSVGCGRSAADRTPPNLVLVTIDSLRPDMLRLWDPAAPTDTPNLDTLAARGVVFSNTWTVTPWTAPAVVSIFTGLYPPSHGVVNRDDTSPQGLPTLTTVLDGAGYEIGDFTFLTGIPYFRNLGFGESAVAGHHTSFPEQLFDGWLQSERPFFAWFHLLEPHLPYGATGYRATTVRIEGSSGLEQAQLRAEVPLGAVEFEPGDREHLIGLYNEDIEAVDTVLGRIFGVLAAKGLLDDTVIVVTADHGEELFDHGWVGHASTAIHAKLEREVLHVPLVIAGPGVPRQESHDGLVQHVDLLPTLCRLLGLETPPDLDGRAVRFGRRGVKSRRDTLYFDTSTGGNLTPAERRRDRLRGVSDGRCLLVRTSVAGQAPTDHLTTVADGPPCDESVAPRFAALLDEWEEAQAAQRLEILQAVSVGAPPPREEIVAYTESIRLTRPAGMTVLEWENTRGLIQLAWTGEAEDYWIEYEIGRGVRMVEGAFKVDEPRLTVGPFPHAFWNDLATHNPYRIRVVAPGSALRSPWVEIEIADTE